MTALLLLLGDGRWPTGGSAHSGGLEAAVADGSVGGLDDLAAYLVGRLITTGAVDAWLAASACMVVMRDGPGAPELGDLDVECEARIAVPDLRAAGRSQGRGLRRSATAAWPAFAVCRAEQLPVVIGAAAAVAGLGPTAAAYLALHGLLVNVASAAPKLMSIDMADALACVARLAPSVDEVATGAAACAAGGGPGPAACGPLADVRALDHGVWPSRLFIS